MKLRSTFLLPVILSAMVLTACGEKPQEPEVMTEAPVAQEAPAPVEAAPAPAAKAEPGGYDKQDRVPGITKTQEELDQIVAEGLEGVPLPDIHPLARQRQ